MKLNYMHKKGKLKTVDFLWDAWNLSQPKGKAPQDEQMTPQERIDEWIIRLGGCPSYEDFMKFGENLDSKRFDGPRKVGRKTNITQTLGENTFLASFVGE